MPAPDMRTVKQVAAALNCSVSHVYNLIGSGDLRADDIATGGSSRRKLRIPADAVTRFLGRTDDAGRPTLTLVRPVA